MGRQSQGFCEGDQRKLCPLKPSCYAPIVSQQRVEQTQTAAASSLDFSDVSCTDISAGLAVLSVFNKENVLEPKKKQRSNFLYLPLSAFKAS